MNQNKELYEYELKLLSEKYTMREALELLYFYQNNPPLSPPPLPHPVVQEYIKDKFIVLSEEDYTNLPKLNKHKNRTPKQHVYTSFCCWLNDNNRKDEMITKKEFFKSMTGKVKEKMLKGKMYYLCTFK
jgi:hypothetical protein